MRAYGARVEFYEAATHTVNNWIANAVCDPFNLEIAPSTGGGGLVLTLPLD